MKLKQIFQTKGVLIKLSEIDPKILIIIMELIKEGYEFDIKIEIEIDC